MKKYIFFLLPLTHLIYPWQAMASEQSPTEGRPNTVQRPTSLSCAHDQHFTNAQQLAALGARLFKPTTTFPTHTRTFMDPRGCYEGF